MFTAAVPEGAGEKKFDETAASMIALLCYGSGFPWNRLEGLQQHLGIPLPAATPVRDRKGNRCPDPARDG